MKVAVTGASGNVGTALLRALADRGHTTVGICRRPPDPVPPYDRTQWVALDLGSPEVDAPLTDALRGVDAVVHLAWIIQPSRDTELLRRVNLGGTRSVLDAVRANNIGHLVHLSSAGVYAPGRGPVGESWTRTGISTSVYSRQKVAVESMLDEAMLAHPELTVTRMRPPIITQRAAAAEIAEYFLGRVAPPVVIRAARRLLPVLPLPRGLRMQFVHAADVADAICAALDRRTGGAFNLAAETVDASALASALRARAVPVPVAPVRALVVAASAARVIPIDAGWFDMLMKIPTLDTTRARRLLGWRPTHSSAEAATELAGAMAEGVEGRSPALSS